MNIHLFLISFVFVFGLICTFKDNKRIRLFYIILCSAVLIFVASMRSPEWMTETYHIDTVNYKSVFESSLDKGWDELWKSVMMRYLEYEVDYDIGFTVLNKVIGYVTSDFHIFSMLANLLFFVPFGIILYRYCTNVYQMIFAFVFFISLILVHFLSGARQMFAIGFDMMALLAMINKKRLLALLFFLIGISIHFSSFLFLIPLLMTWFRFKPLTLKIIHVVCFLLFPLVLLFPNEVIVTMGDFFNMEKYSEYGKNEIRGGADTFIFLIEMLSFFLLIAIKKRDLSRHENFRLFYVMVPLFTLFAPLIHSNGTMIRIALYYSVFLALLVPYAIECMFKKNEKTIAYVVAIGALAFLTISSGGMTYYFYWQR